MGALENAGAWCLGWGFWANFPGRHTRHTYTFQSKSRPIYCPALPLSSWLHPVQLVASRPIYCPALSLSCRLHLLAQGGAPQHVPLAATFTAARAGAGRDVQHAGVAGESSCVAVVLARRKQSRVLALRPGQSRQLAGGWRDRRSKDGAMRVRQASFKGWGVGVLDRPTHMAQVATTWQHWCTSSWAVMAAGQVVATPAAVPSAFQPPPSRH